MSRAPYAVSRILLLLIPSVLCAQVSTEAILSRGLDFERQGRSEDALSAFRQVLTREPANATALLAAERVYTQSGRRDSIMAMAQRALAADPANQTGWTIETRTARAMGGESMAAEVLGRWMAAAPQSEAPYRELVRSLIAVQRYDDAREAVGLARQRFADPARLEPEAAMIESAAGNWPRAAIEWRNALGHDPDLQSLASFNLMPAPAPQRDHVLRALLESDTATFAHRLAAELLLGWNQPDKAWQTLQHALPANPVERRGVLQTFADRARAQEGRGAQLAAAAALERIAQDQPASDAARYRIESARAFAAAGDEASARRVLRAMADDANAPAGVAASATATLVELYAKDGNVEEAARLLAQNKDKIPGSESDRLAHVVARGWIAQGKLDRADSQVAGDESLAAEELRGWTALYRGDLAHAREWLKSPGAPTRGPEAARNVDRAGILALLDAVKGDTLRSLGSALLLAARGDTAGAGRSLAALAHQQRQGQAELLHLAALYTRAAGDSTGAEALWTEIAEHYADQAPAPIAILALARLQAARGDNPGAIQRLEALILNYPASAMVPEARRELDRIRGLVPRS